MKQMKQIYLNSRHLLPSITFLGLLMYKLISTGCLSSSITDFIGFTKAPWCLAVKNSEHCSPDPGTKCLRVPAPDINIINSPLESYDNISPLEILLNNLFKLNILELLLFIILLLLLFNKFIYKFNIELKYKLINKFMPDYISNYYKNTTDKSIDFNNKFTNFIFIIIIIILLLFKLSTLYISAELSLHIDSYVSVYNYIKDITKSS